jgi:coenzyme F420-reducing hydrogenase alpha subunit
MAAEAAGGKITKLTEKKDSDLAQTLQRMAKEAAETAERCEQVASGFDGKKTAILDEARQVKKKATEMMSTYLDEDADALDGFEFLTMAEAAEVGHWSVLQTMNESAGNADVRELVSWALPIQERHFEDVLQGSRKLAADEDPNETA